MEEVAFRFQRLAIVFQVRWEMVVLIPFGKQAVTVTLAEFLEALRLEQRRRKGD